MAAKFVCVLACGFALPTFAPARAGDSSFPVFGPVPPEDWILKIGVQGQYGPKYVGSDHFGFSAMPTFSFRRWNEPDTFTAPDDSVDFTVFGNPRFRFGPSGGVDMGRYVEDDHRLAGLRKVKWGPEAGLFAEYWPILDRLRTRVEVRYGFGYKGFVADLGADWVQPVGRFTFSGGPRLALADRNYMRKYFSVTPADALANPRVTPFSAGSGLRSAGVLGAVGYRWTKLLTTTLFVRYDRLIADAGESPIVKRIGSPDQFTIGVNTTYAFGVDF
jgi:MipA family protein